MLKRVYDIALLFKEYLLFGLLVILSITLLAVNETPQIRAIRSVTVVAVGAVQQAFGFIPNFFELRRENKVLRELNLTLGDEVSRLREGHLENLRLRQLLGLKQRSNYHMVSANVVGKNLQLLRNTITMDVGENDGVRVNMPIITDRGLVGKVIATGGGYSVGQILFNKDLRVSAKIQRSRVDGIIRWDGGSSLTMQNVAKTLDVQAGDVVITSEYSSIFPPGIRIGVVTSTRQVPSALFQAVEVQPDVDFGRLEEAFVVTYVPDSSRAAVERHIRD